MEARGVMDSLMEPEGYYHPSLTLLQSTMGEPLRSEQRTGELLPRLLSRLDMLLLFVAIVLPFPTATVSSIIQGIGNISYLYWFIAAATFLVPGAIVTGQLNRFMPVDGSIYVWTHRAMGELWGFFAGFCAWLPGVLMLLIVGENVISSLQDVGVSIAGPQAGWLTEPWQQGLLILAILAFIVWLSSFPLQFVMKFVKGATLLYLLVYLIIGLAGVVWLLSGHRPQPVSASSHFGSGLEHIIAPYALGVLALLGVEVPLNLAAETQQRTAATFALRWGPLLVLAASLLGTFGFLIVVPAQSSATYLETVKIVFGVPVSVLLDLILVGSFVFIGVALNLAFARILFVAALDYRLPAILARVNRHEAPFTVMAVQVTIVVILVVMAYFLGPLLFSMEGIMFSHIVYDVTVGAIMVIWCLSTAILFLDLPLLLHRFRGLLAENPDQLIAPRWILYLSCAMGGIASLTGIAASLSASVDSQLIPDSRWGTTVGGVVLALLAIGLIGSSYPRLVGNLDKQTDAARENARLLNELRTAYARLSELNQLKDAFLSTANHELRTPLTIVHGYLELLAQGEDVTPEMRSGFLRKARRACEEWRLLQENLLDSSRIEFDTAALRCTYISLKDICTSVVELFEPLLLREQRPVEIDVTENITVYADETRLKQILRNLIANAMRYSPPQTPLRLTAALEEEKHLVRIYVIDRGLGIPPDKHKAIFERFVRLERDRQGSVPGSGLGLAITRQLVEAMQGTITVESSGIKGEGSTFSFTLPGGRYEQEMIADR